MLSRFMVRYASRKSFNLPPVKFRYGQREVEDGEERRQPSMYPIEEERVFKNKFYKNNKNSIDDWDNGYERSSDRYKFSAPTRAVNENEHFEIDDNSSYDDNSRYDRKQKSKRSKLEGKYSDNGYQRSSDRYKLSAPTRAVNENEHFEIDDNSSYDDNSRYDRKQKSKRSKLEGKYSDNGYERSSDRYKLSAPTRAVNENEHFEIDDNSSYDDNSRYDRKQKSKRSKLEGKYSDNGYERSSDRYKLSAPTRAVNENEHFEIDDNSSNDDNSSYDRKQKSKKSKLEGKYSKYNKVDQKASNANFVTVGEMIFGIHPIYHALQAQRRKIYHIYHKTGLETTNGKLRETLELAKQYNVSVLGVSASHLKGLVGDDRVHQGICCDASLLSFEKLEIESLVEENSPTPDVGLKEENSSTPDVGLKEENSSTPDVGLKEENSPTPDVGLKEENSPTPDVGLKEENSPTPDVGLKEENSPTPDVGLKEENSPTPDVGLKEENSPTPDVGLIEENSSTPDVNEEEKCERNDKKGAYQLWLYLDRIQDPMNFGAILRSAYYMGVDKVLTSKDHSCRLTGVVSKASAGAAECLPVYQVDDVRDLFETLTDQGWNLVSTAAADKESVSLSDYKPSGNIVLAVGNEGLGISADLKDMFKSTITVQPGRILPDGMDSLNVSVATAIILYDITSKMTSMKIEEISDR